MPVSGNEEQPGVLSWPLLDVSAGIPLKKRRLVLVPPPSPPRHEAQSSPSKETDNGKKIDEAQSSPCKETDNMKRIDGSCSDLKKEESLPDLKIPEQSNPVCKSIPESVPTVKKIGGDNQSESLNPEESGSEVIGKEPALDLKSKHVIDSDQGPLSSSPPDNTPDLSEARLVDSLGVETKSLLTEEYAAPDVPLNTVGFPLADHDGKIQYKQELMVQNNEGSSSGHGKSDASLLSLSLSKGTCSMETKATDGGMCKGKDDLSPSRMNWDLNTPMDSWDGSDVDAAVPASEKASCMTTNPNSIPQFLNSTDSGGIFINKGKQLIGNEEHTSKHSSCLIASIQGNHEVDDSLRLTLGVASQGMKKDKRLSAEVASRKYVLDSSPPNAAISTASAGSIGFGIVKPEPSGDNSKKTSVQPIGHLRGFVDSCSVKRESTERPGKESSAGLSVTITEKPSGQTSIKAEPVMEDRRELPQVDDVALQHGLLKISRFHYGGTSGLLAPLSPQKSHLSSLASSSVLSASVVISNQSEFTFQNNDIQARNGSSVQAAAKVPEHAQKFLETEASGREIVTVKSDVKFSKNSEINQLKINKNHNNMRVTGEGSVSDEEKLNISVETTEYEGYGSDYESEGNQGFAVRSNIQNICAREEDDFEDGEVREAQAHLHTGDANVETLGTECVKAVNSDANSSVCIDGEIGNNMNDNTLGNPGDRTVDNIKECVDMVSVGIYERLTYQDANLTKKLSDGIAAVATNDKLLVDTSQVNPFDQSGKGIIPDVKENGIVCDEPSSACYRTVETMGEATDDNVNSDGMGNKLYSSPSKVDTTLKRDGACIESTNGGNKSRIITLPRTSVTSLFESKSFPSNSLSSRSGREREEFDSDGRQGFIRERFQEPHFRNPRNNYMRGRGGRFAGRMGNPRVEWDSERELSGRSSGALRHFNRSKCSAYNDMEMEPSNYPNPRDGSPLDTSRGRKPVKELPSFHHPFSRRQSPGGDRDDPPTRDTQMLHKVPRNASPGRRNNDVHGADFVGVRNEKFSRPLRNDTINSSYNRSHSGYEDGDGQFVRGRGARNFSTGQRRFFPRVRSKSPIGSRTHSPGGQWSPRRRSPDRFKVHPKVVQRRPAPSYGADRMSSPDRLCFPEDIVARRRGSPSYVGRATNDPRDVDSGSEHGHPRPFNSRRSPSDRVFSRGSGRPDVMGPRIRGCDDDFFSRPPHSGGFREVNGEGSSNDDRRKCGERISFRPPYNADNDNRHFQVNDGPRSFRFRSDGGDTEYAGRNMGDNREFDGRVKNRPAVAPRRMNY